jgi:hypothetical protein
VRSAQPHAIHGCHDGDAGLLLEDVGKARWRKAGNAAEIGQARSGRPSPFDRMEHALDARVSDQGLGAFAVHARHDQDALEHVKRTGRAPQVWPPAFVMQHEEQSAELLLGAR